MILRPDPQFGDQLQLGALNLHKQLETLVTEMGMRGHPPDHPLTQQGAIALKLQYADEALKGLAAVASKQNHKRRSTMSNTGGKQAV